MQSNDTITFPGFANESVGTVPGDVIFVVQELGHELFQRQGCDLVLKKKISLAEALTGLRFHFAHLDGSTITVSSSPEDVRFICFIFVRFFFFAPP